MSTNIRLQGSWYYSRAEDGIVVGSYRSGRRFRVHGDPEPLLAGMRLLGSGVEGAVPARSIAAAANLPLARAQALTEFLSKEGALISDTADSLDGHSKFDRQVRFFSAFECADRSATMMNETLRGKTVLTVGLGGYGTWVTMMLARMGIRRIVAIDFDTVERSNLNRQVLFNEGHVGMTKVEAVREALERDTPEVQFDGHVLEVRSPEDLLPYLDGIDLIMNSFGYESEAGANVDLVNRAALIARVPSLVFGGSWIGPLTVPGRTACFGCVVADPALREVIDASFARLRSDVFERHGHGGTIAPRVGITTTLATWEATRFLSEMDPAPTLNGIITLDTLEYSRPLFKTIARLDSCALCGTVEGQK